MELSNQAQGRWHGILTHVGVDPVFLRNRNGPCAGCGGTDRFRWDDKDGNGTFYCNGGGDPVAGDGFGLIKHIFQCDFPAAARMVEGALGIKKASDLPQIPKRPPPKPKAPTVTKALRIWEDANTDDANVASHPYCELKGIKHACGAGRGRVTGSQVGKAADCIIVPLRSLSGALKGVEVIGVPVWDEEKQKHVTPKQTFGSKGILFLGNTLDMSLPVYLVEGWADAVSTWRQMGNVVVCAVFGDKKRQEFYAQGFDEHNPDREYILVRDA
jgi:phage/plasmid primase-like uncharacterized protein